MPQSGTEHAHSCAAHHYESEWPSLGVYLHLPVGSLFVLSSKLPGVLLLQDHHATAYACILKSNAVVPRSQIADHFTYQSGSGLMVQDLDSGIQSTDSSNMVLQHDIKIGLCVMLSTAEPQAAEEAAVFTYLYSCLMGSRAMFGQ